MDWAFAAQASLAKLVQENWPEEVHRWPLLPEFDAETYVWNDQCLLLVLRDKLLGLTSMGSTEQLPEGGPQEAPTRANIEAWHDFARARFSVGPKDMVVVIPTSGEGPRVEDDWAQWSQEDKDLWMLQLELAANRHLAYLQELDARKGAMVRQSPQEIAESLEAFRRDHPDPDRTGFLIMRLIESAAHDAIARAVRQTAEANGLTIVRADDKEYHPDLFPNVLTYIHGSGFGIAVFERIEEEQFNPNVSLEVGYMLALEKPVCILKDRTLKALNTDLLGKLYRTFEPQDAAGTVPRELTSWLRDKGLIPTVK